MIPVIPENTPATRHLNHMRTATLKATKNVSIWPEIASAGVLQAPVWRFRSAKQTRPFVRVTAFALDGHNGNGSDLPLV